MSVRNSLIVTRSMAAVESDKKAWKDITEFNTELDRLAELSGAQFQHVISRAAECQELYESQLADASVVPDTVSFNTVLKGWARCCNALSEKSRNHGSFPDDIGHKVPVYTTRDAAERATTLLLEQETKKDGARPDVASYNIVIGKYDAIQYSYRIYLDSIPDSCPLIDTISNMFHILIEYYDDIRCLGEKPHRRCPSGCGASPEATVG